MKLFSLGMKLENGFVWISQSFKNIYFPHILKTLLMKKKIKEMQATSSTDLEMWPKNGGLIYNREYIKNWSPLLKIGSLLTRIWKGYIFNFFKDLKKQKLNLPGRKFLSNEN